MNKRFLSTLLTGAIFLAATSMFVSCKDYDDDIKNLQAQIDKAALKSEVEALQMIVRQVQENAASKADLEAAKTALSADIKKAQDAADAAGRQAAQAISDAAKAQSAADAAQSFAETVKLTADAALALAKAAATKDELDAAKKELTGLITKAQSTADAALALAEAAATKAEFDAAVEKLTKAAADAQATADEALKIAKAAATKAEFDEAVETLTKAAADAQATADEAKALAEAAATKVELAEAKEELKEYARNVAEQAKDAAVVAAKAYANELAAKQAEIDAAQDAAVAAALENYATQEAVASLASNLYDELDELKDAISKTATEAAFEILSDEVKAYGAQIDVLFCAVSSVELFASYSYSYKAPSVDGQLFYGAGSYATSTTDVSNAHLAYTTITIFGIPIQIPNGVTVDVDVDTEVNTDIWAGIAPLTSVIFHGTVPEDSKFGDNEDAFGQKADKEIEYKKGADVKDEAELIVRVNPVNADITSADIRLINSLGEDLNDVFVVTKAERYNQLLTTRGATINSGLWKLTLKAADGLTEEAYEDAVYVKENDDILATKKFAVAINNTVKDNADRFVASTFDFIPVYAEFEPAKEFTFKVNDVDVENVRNRWTWDYREQELDLYIMSEMQYDHYYDNPELAWNPEVDNAPTAEPVYKGDDMNVVVDGNVYTLETRRWQTFVYADVNEPIVLSDFFGIGEFEYPGQQIEYYYVVFDKGNAIESAPSEWNAWKDYTVEGLGKMTKVDDKLTMKITSEEAHGDVVGFRVFAVNRDGSLADPDGRAFYVFVGKPGEDNRAESANIIATEEQPESEEMDVAGWFKAGRTYFFSTTNFSGKNENPAWITEGPTEEEFIFDNAILTFYDKDGEALEVNFEGGYVYGDDIKDAVKVTFKPNDNIASMLNGATYTIYISQSEQHAGDYLSMPYATLAITKVMPTEGKALEFRPKQEGEWNDKGVWTSKDGTGKFLAYMIPNTNIWQTPWATQFTEDYAVGDVYRDNGFKDLNNIFYNLNNDTTFEFVFSTSLFGENDALIDLVDENGEGIMFGKPGSATRPELAEDDMPYVLDVATEFIDYKTEHAVQVYSNYFGVSTYYAEDGSLVFGENWKVAGQQFTAIYGCWHHAMHDIKFKPDVTLQWSHEGTESRTTLANVTTQNYYNATYFAKPLNVLIANGWLVLDTEKDPVLSTQPNAKGQINPYFVPTLDGNNGIVFNQKGTQVDANPTADHKEYLNIFLKDAFGHEVIVSSEVTIKKAASNAPAL